MKHATRFSILVCTLLAGLVACSGANSALRRSSGFLERGDIYLAFQTLEKAREENPGDEAIEREYWRLRLEYLLYEGRRRVFEDREVEAIELFHQALALDPDNPEAEAWIGKARRKLAIRAVRRAEDLRYTGELQEALKVYAEALSYVPGYEPALAGQRKVTEHFEDRQEKAQRYLLAGTKRFEERRHPESQHHAIVAEEHDPALEGVDVLHTKNERRIAHRRYEFAQKMEKEGRYGAALLHYRLVAEQVPDFGGIDTRIAQMDREVEAQRLKFQATVELARAYVGYTAPVDIDARLDEAGKLLDQAYEKSVLQRPEIGDLMQATRERRYEYRYFQAKDLELQGRHRDALALYRQIDEEWPDGFRDVKARISGLEDAVELAEQAFQAGLAAEEEGDMEAALSHYREAVLHCRNYKGLDARILQLTTRQ